MLSPEIAAILTRFGISAESLDTAIGSLFYITVITLLTSVATWLVAKRKHRSVILWVSLALSVPVLPLLILWFLPDVTPDQKS